MDRIGPLPAHAIKSAARAEAAWFVFQVRRGTFTIEIAIATLDVEPKLRALLENFAEASPAEAAGIRSVLEMRDLALAEFRRLMAEGLRPAA